MVASARLAPAPPERGATLVFAAIAGLLLLAVGAFCLLGYLAWPLLETRAAQRVLGPDAALRQAAEFAVLAVYGLGIGIGLLWQVLRAWQGAPSSRFRAGGLLGLGALVMFPLALLVGVRSLDLPHREAGYLFPLAALVVVLAPPLLLLSLLARAGWTRAADGPPAADTSGGGRPGAAGQVLGRSSREDPFAADLQRRVVGPPTWRRVLGALTWGLAGATTIAAVLEVVAAVAGLVLVLGVLFVLGRQTNFTGLQSLLGNGDSLGCSAVQSAFANPLVIGGLVLALGVVVPLIEEPAKSLAVVWLRGRLAVPRDALLYGAAAGIGFGMIESAFYNVGDVRSWWGTATLRLGTTFVHALATGLFGVAWFYRLQRRDRPRFRRYALASVGVHGLWNASTVGIMAVSALRTCTTDPVGLLMQGDPAGLAGAVFFGFLTVSAALALMALARRLGPSGPAPDPARAGV